MKRKLPLLIPGRGKADVKREIDILPRIRQGPKLAKPELQQNKSKRRRKAQEATKAKQNVMKKGKRSKKQS